MILDLLAELRDRLDVPTDVVSDEQLSHVLDVSVAAVVPWIGTTITPHPQQDSIDEATVQLAVKVFNAGARGVVDTASTGDWTTPAPAATPGLVRSVFGVLAPAMPTGGVSV